MINIHDLDIIEHRRILQNATKYVACTESANMLTIICSFYPFLF